MIAERSSLVIYDSFFPHPLSSFRTAEISGLLDEFPLAIALCDGTDLNIIKEKNSIQYFVKRYRENHFSIGDRVRVLTDYSNFKADLLYCVFLNNIYRILPHLERSNTPFVFTLYPGGGFRINEEASDKKLARVLSSAQFRGVIVTQKISYDYIVKRDLCLEQQVKFIYGAVFNAEEFARLESSRWTSFSDCVNILFVANKYMKSGRDKGYDIFIECVRLLSRNRSVSANVVGGFSEADYDISGLEGIVTFHGQVPTDKLKALYSKMHLLLSPNRAFELAPGAFDGFPTGAAVEAALSGVPIFVTDSLGQNQYFSDGEELVILRNHDPAEITGVIEKYINNPNDLMKLSNAGRLAFLRYFDSKFQIQERSRFISLFYKEIQSD
jgi:glycosyltransferase involved in cell wall biosynthesis